MSLVYRAFYRLGLTPWEQDDPVEPLADLVTGPDALAPGRALDIGCGTGSDAIFCARNGWQVTGIDDVPLALKRARAKAAAAGVDVRFVQADVTRTGPERIGTGYRLMIDMGCLHNLEPAGPARGRPAAHRGGGAGRDAADDGVRHRWAEARSGRSRLRGRQGDVPGLGRGVQPAGARRPVEGADGEGGAALLPARAPLTPPTGPAAGCGLAPGGRRPVRTGRMGRPYPSLILICGPPEPELSYAYGIVNVW